MPLKVGLALSRETVDNVTLELPCRHLSVEQDVEFFKCPSHGLWKPEPRPDETQ